MASKDGSDWLESVPPAFRQELSEFQQIGVAPHDHLLFLIVTGDWRGAIRLIGDGPSPLNAILDFLEHELPDFAWGRFPFVVRWQVWGGKQGWAKRMTR